MAKSNEKFNNSCLKMFELLSLLIDDNAEYENVIKLFSDESSNIKSNPNVVLNKYLNTLKVVGIEVKKIKNKYHLIHTPITMDLDDEDIAIINRIKKFMDIYPDGKNKDECLKFIKNIEARYDEKTKIKFEELNTAEGREYSLYFNKHSEKITLFEKYIQSGQKLQITYKDKETTGNITGIPVELNYTDKKMFLTISTRGKCSVVVICIEDIIEANPLPTQNPNVQYATTVVFKIKDRLVKNYRLRNFEHITREENGDLVIVNNGEDLNHLIRRLMRYGTQCEIISPKFLQREMKKLIEDTLSNYE